MFQVGITPYISPTHQETLDILNSKAETCHFAELEQALAVMMDGVLEVRWEDEIKKNITKPKCMVSYSYLYLINVLLTHVNFIIILLLLLLTLLCD
jgi:hypothetical protein